MNTIFFDLSVCQPSGTSKFHGGGIYGYIVFKQLVLTAPKQIIAYYNKSKFLDSDVANIINYYDTQVFDAVEYNLEQAFTKSGADIFYTPLYSSRYINIINKGANCIVTIHGLRPLECFSDKNEYLYYNTWRSKIAYLKKVLFTKFSSTYYEQYQLALSKPNVRIVTVSKHSKYSIKTYFPDSDLSQISVKYSPSTSPLDYKKYIHTNNEKYFLLISADRWLKNSFMAISALDELFENKLNVCDKVVVVGLSKQSSIYKRIKHKDKFVLEGYLSKDELENLFAGAYGFIYPTLNEGFGYPPLEAMKYGVPVITSPYSSIPEICGNAVLYANPHDKKEIENRILQLNDIEIYSLLKARSLERYEYIDRKQSEDLTLLVHSILNNFKQ